MTKREISASADSSEAPGKKVRVKTEGNEEAGTLSIAESIWLVGSIPVNVIDNTLGEKEKDHAIKFAKLALTEKAGNQARAEFIKDELQAIYDEFEWTCLVASNLGKSGRPSTKPHIIFTLGPDTVVVTKNDRELEVEVLDCRMEEQMKENAIKVVQLAMICKKNEGDFAKAKYIRDEFNTKYGKYWNATVGREPQPLYFAPNHSIRFRLGSTFITLAKCPLGLR